MKTGVLEEMKVETLPITSYRGLWFLFNVQMAFHNRKSNIYKFSFFHLLLNFEINVTQYFADISILANDICQGAQLIRCHKASLHSESYTCNLHSFWGSRSRLYDLNNRFIEIQEFFSIFTALFILVCHYMYVYLDREGREEPSKKFEKSVIKMAVMHE